MAPRIEIIPAHERQRWDSVVKSFRGHDVYYLSGYLRNFQVHGDGEPILFHYQSEGLRAISAAMKRDIGTFGPLMGAVPENRYFDIVTPYGYGGFLFEGDLTQSNLDEFGASYEELLKKENIVSEFVSYHPMLKNAGPMKAISGVTDLGKTISIDLCSPETIWENITPKNRNMIRKAEKNGVEIFHETSEGIFREFKQIYNATMQHDQADPYYFFGDDFYRSIHDDLRDNYQMFYAVHQGTIIAMSIILYANSRMHYHLSGSRFEYRHLAPTNLLLYKAALWGCENGIKSFHLGGGLGSGEDNLYKFKEAFNRRSDNRFSIGKRIVDREVYDHLAGLRTDARFDPSSHYFPLYRNVTHH